MASTLSDAEFERIQNQLLDLKTLNYALEEKCKIQEVESQSWKLKCDHLEKDLTKYQNLAKLNPLAFAKSLQFKKDQKDLTETLIDKRDNFQKKLHQQEDEFRLTNDMLKQEIFNLMKENDLLRKNSKIIIKNDESNNDKFKQNFNDNKDCIINKENFIEINNTIKGMDKISFALLSEKEQLESDFNEVNKNLSQVKDEKQVLLDKTNKLGEKVQDLEESNLKLNKAIVALKEQNKTFINENVNLKNEIIEIEKESNNFKELASKRKSTIDELQCHIEDISVKAQMTMENANKKVNEIKSSLNKELNLLKTEKKELLNKISDLQNNIDKNSNLEVQCTIYEKNLESLNETISNLNKKLEELKNSNIKSDVKKNQLENDYQFKINELESKITILIEQVNEKDLIINKLNRDLEDQIEERKIHEKKGVMYVRELQKQLNNEKKQREKLQEKFGDFLSEKSLEVNSTNFDTKSVGSWSFLSSKDQSVLGKNTSTFSIHSSTDGKEVLSNGISSPTNDLQNNMTNSINISPNHNQLLEKENTQLVSRLTNLQQEKWTLEEKLNQSLLINQKLTQECELKQKVISFYCMERRFESKLNTNQNEKFTVKKVVDFIKDKGDGSLKEINRKLQRMLEEILIKNMHLQTNLESLTDEIHALKKTNELKHV